jgi:hypothetical protein
MLRALVVVLFLANAAYFCWTQGWLNAVVSVRPNADHEPERLNQQLHADQLLILSPQQVASEKTKASLPPPVCLQAGPMSEADLEAIKVALAGDLPQGGWTVVGVETAPVHLVYMGPYPAPELLSKKGEELKRMKLEFAPVTEPSELNPGYALGRYDTQAAAEEALAKFSQRGIRTARVLALPAGPGKHILRVPSASAPLAEKLKAFAHPALTSPFQACP